MWPSTASRSTSSTRTTAAAYLESPKYGTQYFNIARYGKEMGDIVTPAMDTVWEGAMAPAEVVDEICTKVDEKLAELQRGLGTA